MNRHPLDGIRLAGVLWLAASPLLSAADSVVEIGPAAAASRVPHWDAQGPGPLPRQGIACLELSPQRSVSIKLDYVPHHDTRFGVADFNGDGRADLAGFGRSPTGAVGVYIWLQPGDKAK